MELKKMNKCNRAFIWRRLPKFQTQGFSKPSQVNYLNLDFPQKRIQQNPAEQSSFLEKVFR